MADRNFDYTINTKVNINEASAAFEKFWTEAKAGSAEAKAALNKALGGQIKTEAFVRINADTGQVEKGFKTIYSELDKIEKAQQKVTRAQEGSITSLRQSLNTWKQKRDAVAKYTQAVDASGAPLFKGKTAVMQLNQEWVAANKNVNQAANALRQASSISFGGLKLPDFSSILSLGNKFSQITLVVQAVVAAFQQLGAAVDAVVQRARQIAALDLTLQNFGLTAQQSSETLAQAKTVALTYGASLAGVEQAYKKLTPSIVASGGSLGETDQVISAMTARMTALGLTTDESNRYINAFSQVMGKGKLQGEELNQQLAEIDPSLRANLASYLSTTYGINDMESAMKNGQITSKIFREFMIEAGKAAQESLAKGVTAAQQEINKLNPQQIQNVVNTLNTISLEGLAKTFGGFGREIAAIQVAIAQFFTAVTTNLPNLSEGFSRLFRAIGVVGRYLVVGFLAGLQAILFTIDKISGAFRFVVEEVLLKLPIVKQIVQGIVAVAGFIDQRFRAGADAILQMDQSMLGARQTQTKWQEETGKLVDLYNQNKITLSELKTKLQELRAAEAAEERKQEAAELIGLLNEQKAIIDEKIEALKVEKEDNAALADQQQELIDKTKQAYDDRKAKIEQEISLLETAYSKRLRALDDEISRLERAKALVYEKYRIEQGQIDALSADAEAKRIIAERYELRSLELKRQQGQLSEEEAARLDAQIAQKKASLAQSELDLKIKKETAPIDENIKKLNEDKKRIEKERTNEIQKHKDKLKEVENQEAAVLRKMQDTLDAIKANGKAIDANISKLERENRTIDAQVKKLDNVRQGIDNIGRSINNLNSIEVRVAKVLNPRAAGGPVQAGKMYQVNELGKEAFLSNSGKLSMINKPAYGAWRAPSSGTVIPAHITESLNLSNAMTASVPSAAKIHNSGSGSQLNKLASAVIGAMRGDNIQNNVTIQAANTTQAASDILVQLTKIKRRRYS